MKAAERVGTILKWLKNYVIFFVVVAFMVTCCTMLFTSTLSRTLGITLTGNILEKAAKLTFANVVILSLLFCVIDGIRRRLTVSRPVRQITNAAEAIMQGDFSVRIQPKSVFGGGETFLPIVECFNRMAEELGNLETLRTDFIANVSHEMKTPLSVMQNYGTLLQAPELTEEERIAYAKGITDSSRRLSSMITNILKLNRLENQQIYPQITEIDLGEQLCECLLQFENVWEASEIEIDTQIAENVTVRADEELLRLVWNNLLSNAFKFTGAGGTVTVTLSTDGAHAVVQIRDTGCGMTPEVGKHIFEKFYQGDTSHSTQGNGLGLALVKRVIDIMHGEISVESASGKGSTFTVKIRSV